MVFLVLLIFLFLKINPEMTAPQYIKYLPFYLFFLLLLLVTVKFPFFWDTVQLASKHAHFFYETGFSSIILPNEIDSGHIPTLGIYLAMIWKIAGKSLIVSHLAMFPFVFGIVYQSIILVRRYYSSEWHYYALALLLADATLLAQCTLVSPDVLVVFFLLMSFNNLFPRKQFWGPIALAGLALSSMRGMMCIAGLFLAEMLLYISHEKIELSTVWLKKTFLFAFRAIKAYLPAIILAFTFLAWHYYKTGWIGYHKEMPWYTLFQRVGFKGAIWNTFILGWRLIDFGRIFVWLTGMFCLWHFFRNRPVLPGKLKTILIILLSMLIALCHAAILHRNLSAHRYFLPIYLLISLLVTYYLFEVIHSRFWKKAAFYIMFAGMLSGNFLIYPDNVDKGWDSSLAYLPYFSLRERMMNYMDKEGIAINETGTLFPNLSKLKYIDLSDKDDAFAELDLKTNRYVFYSNIYNGFPAAQLYELKSYWRKLKEYRFMGVKIILYCSPGLK
jgi:hypothetical protein